MTTPDATPRPPDARALLERQREVLEMIARGRPLPDILAALCLAVEAEAGDDVRASILLVDAARGCLVTGAAPSLPEAYNRALDGVPVAEGLGTCCDAAARAQAVTTTCIARAPGWATLAHLPLELGLVACWSMPVLDADGSVLATFGTYFRVEREPTPAEQALVATLAQTAALAIQREQRDAALRAREARHRFLAELGMATQGLIEAGAVVQESARQLAGFLGADRVAYANIEDESLFAIIGDYSPSLPSIVGRWPIAAFGAECERCMRAGEPYVVSDSEHDPRIGEADLPAYRATQIRAVICLPLHKGGRLTAAMAVHQASVRYWGEEDIELVRDVVARCREALERARVTDELRASEARYRAMVEANPECVKLVDADGTLLQMNAAGLRMIEAAGPDAALGQCVYNLIVPEDRARFAAFNERVCAGEGGELAFQIVGLGGTRRWMETTATPLRQADGRYAHLAVTRDVSARVRAERALMVGRRRAVHRPTLPPQSEPCRLH